jgi:hypothetical protein
MVVLLYRQEIQNVVGRLQERVFDDHTSSNDANEYSP